MPRRSPFQARWRGDRRGSVRCHWPRSAPVRVSRRTREESMRCRSTLSRPVSGRVGTPPLATMGAGPCDVEDQHVGITPAGGPLGLLLQAPDIAHADQPHAAFQVDFRGEQGAGDDVAGESAAGCDPAPGRWRFRPGVPRRPGWPATGSGPGPWPPGGPPVRRRRGHRWPPPWSGWPARRRRRGERTRLRGGRRGRCRFGKPRWPAVRLRVAEKCSFRRRGGGLLLPRKRGRLGGGGCVVSRSPSQRLHELY